MKHKPVIIEDMPNSVPQKITFESKSVIPPPKSITDIIDISINLIFCKFFSRIMIGIIMFTIKYSDYRLKKY